jgi:RNA polymerase sigma-70 factor, ECF subfamily
MPEPPLADQADEALMLAYAAGNAAAFDVLYGRHKGASYRYLLRHCGVAAQADELFQDVWMNVIRVRATYAPTAKFTTWLYTLAHNRLVDHWRANGQAHLVSIDDDDDTATRDTVEAIAAPAQTEPAAVLEQHDARTRIVRALASLPPAQRDAFLLQQEGGLSLAEIAQMTGVGAETVKSRLRYALAKLRSELAVLREDQS